MKVLTVVHNFLPRHHAGAELYTYYLAKALGSRHDLTILTVDHSLFRRNYSRRNYEYDGLSVIEITNHRRYERFDQSYADMRMAAHFRHIARQMKPDLVHFQHLLHHSVAYPQIARELGIPSVMTLHEYWFLCGRNGQLIQADGERCFGPQLSVCAKCMSSFVWGRRGVDVWALRGIETLKKFTGVDLKARARRVRMAQAASAEPPVDAADDMRKLLLMREARVRDMFDHTDCFIAPSRFLRDRFAAFGVPSEQIVVSDYGTDLARFSKLERVPRAGKLRIGFLGSVQVAKGVHVLLAALDRLAAESFEARIWGDLASRPEYSAELETQARESVHFMGRVAAERIPDALASMDVLVVPSLWWENSPLVIHEAFAAKVPVICSGIGGMAELVPHDVAGWHVRPGDPADLAKKLQRLIDRPEEIDRLRAGIPPLKTIAQDAAFHGEVYEAVVNAWA
jgi:glycosyltransferase involved in cell wall biosynthesis